MRAYKVIFLLATIVIYAQAKIELPAEFNRIIHDLFDGDTPQHQFIRNEFEKFRQQEMMRAGSNDNITSQVAFRLYTKSNPNNSINLEPNVASVVASPFNPLKPTRFMTHGFWSSGDSDTSQSVKNAYLKHQDVNVILVDWNGPAATLNYISAALNTVPIGQYTARLIDTLVDSGASYSNIHLVGHSLGAHISGFASRYARNRVARISGLDPAGPLFETIPIVPDHLSPDKADFVDIIHTSAGALGYRAPIGNVDFYPNEGTAPQPGCEGITYVLGPVAPMIDSCSHGRSWEYFADSINPRELYIAEPEPNLVSKKPNHYFDMHELMGEYVNQNGHGTYWLRTNSHPPYALDVRT